MNILIVEYPFIKQLQQAQQNQQTEATAATGLLTILLEVLFISVLQGVTMALVF